MSGDPWYEVPGIILGVAAVTSLIAGVAAGFIFPETVCIDRDVAPTVTIPGLPPPSGDSPLLGSDRGCIEDHSFNDQLAATITLIGWGLVAVWFAITLWLEH